MTDKDQPKVSCLMVTANRKHFVVRSLMSFKRQTYKNKELIIVDDGQEDLSTLLADLPANGVKYIKLEKKEENILGSLRNISLQEATGDFVTQWDDDDWYHPDRIRIQAEVLLQGYEMCCLSSALIHIDSEPFFDHPYISFFRKGVPGSIMHQRDFSIQYPRMRIAEDDIYLKTWLKRPYIKLPISFAHLFIRCFHGANTWHKEHFLKQMRNTLPDLASYGWHHFIRRDVCRHRRFRLDEQSRHSFSLYLQDSLNAGLFSNKKETCV